MCEYFTGTGKIFVCVRVGEMEKEADMRLCVVYKAFIKSMFCERVHVCGRMRVCACVFSSCPRGRVLNNRPFLTGWDAESCQPPPQAWDEQRERQRVRK